MILSNVKKHTSSVLSQKKLVPDRLPLKEKSKKENKNKTKIRLKYISTTKGWVKKMPGRRLAWMRRDPGNTSRQSPPSSLRNRKNKY